MRKNTINLTYNFIIPVDSAAVSEKCFSSYLRESNDCSDYCFHRCLPHFHNNSISIGKKIMNCFFFSFIYFYKLFSCGHQLVFFFFPMLQITLDSNNICNNNSLPAKTQDNSTVMVKSISVIRGPCYYTLFADVRIPITRLKKSSITIT